MSEKQQKQPAHAQVPQRESKLQQAKVHPQPTNLEYIQQYKEILQHQVLSTKQIDKLVDQLYNTEGVQYDPNFFYQQLQAKIVKNMPNYHVVTFDIKFGFFKFTATVYCQDQQSYSHYLKSKNSRQQSIIYLSPPRCQDMAIKCFPVLVHDQVPKVFGTALKEFCFFKIASGLGVGPQVKKMGGFDLVMYQKCIQFGMEKCLELGEDISSQRTNIIIRNIQQKIAILHHFQIIHLDIKPSNIMFSPSKQMAIYIDYGFSKHIKQKLGSKSMSQFFGSINYCGPQMLRAFSNEGQQQYIDLYYNDAYCLKSTIEEIRHFVNLNTFSMLQNDFQDGQNQQVVNAYGDKIQNFIDAQATLKIKAGIYSRNQDILNSSQAPIIIKKYSHKIIQFILEFPYYRYIDTIFQFIIKTCLHEQNAAIYRRRMQYKKQIILKENVDKEDNPKNNIFMKRLEINLAKQTIQQTKVKLDCEVRIVFFENVAKKLMRKSVILEMPQMQHYFQVANVVDLRNISTPAEEKLTIIAVFNQIFKLNHKTISSNSTLPEIEVLFKYFLQYYLEKLPIYYQKVIPLAIINLVIIEAISPDKIIEIINQIGRMHDPFKAALCLFRLHCIFDWIIQKMYSRYYPQHIQQMHRAFKSAFNELIYVNEDKVDRVFLVYVEDMYFSSIGESKKYNWSTIKSYIFLKQLPDMDEKTLQELMVWVIFEAYKKYQCQDSQNSLQLFNDLHQFSNFSITQYGRIDYINIRLWRYYPRISLKMMLIAKQSEDNNQQYLKQFYFFYNRLIMNNSQQQMIFLIESGIIDRNLQFLLQIYERQDSIKMAPFMRLLYNLDLNCRKTKIPTKVYEIGKQIRRIINLNQFNKWSSKMNNNNCSFLMENALYFVRLSMNHYPKDSELIKSIKGSINRWKQINPHSCLQCLRNLSHQLLKIQIQFMILQQNAQGMFQLCIQQLITSKKDPLVKNYQCSYIGQMTQALLYCGVNDQQYQRKQLRWVFNVVHKNNYFQHVFCHTFGHHLYKFLCEYSLIYCQDIQLYMIIHSELLNMIKKYPNRQHIRIYMQYQRQFMLYAYEDIVDKIQGLIEQTLMVASKTYWDNPYLCIHISALLSFPKESQYHYQLLVQLLKRVDIVSINARVYALSDAFYFLYKDQAILNNIRSRRRKLINYANYLFVDKGFKMFSSSMKVQLNRKKARRNIHWQKLMKKWKLFYRCVKQRYFQ